MSTPGDLLFHIRAERADMCFEFERLLLDALGDSVAVEDEVQGFRYFDARDLLGFVDAQGTEHDILRDNMPFGRPGHSEFGTYFIGYARNLWVIEKMLQNMFLGFPEGQYDRILDFSNVVTGTTFFAPSNSLLVSLGD